MQVSYLRLVFLSAFCSLLAQNAHASMLRANGSDKPAPAAEGAAVSRASTHDPRAQQSYEKVAAAVESVAKEINGFTKQAFDKSKDLKKWCADNAADLVADMSGHEGAKKALKSQLDAVEKAASKLQQEIASLEKQLEGDKGKPTAQVTIEDKLRAALSAKKDELADRHGDIDRLNRQIEHTDASLAVGKQLQKSTSDECGSYEQVFNAAMHRLSIESNAAQRALEYIYPSLLDRPVPAQIYSSNAKFFIDIEKPSPAAVSLIETAVRRHRSGAVSDAAVSAVSTGDDPLGFIKKKIIEIIAQMAGEQERDMEKGAYCKKSIGETQKKIEETEIRRQEALNEIGMYKTSVGGWSDGEKFMAKLTDKLEKEQDEMNDRFGSLVKATKTFVDQRKLLADKIEQAIEELTVAVTYAPKDKSKIENAVSVLSSFDKSLKETRETLQPGVTSFEKKYSELAEALSLALNARKGEQEGFRFAFELASTKLQRAKEDLERRDRELQDLNALASQLAAQCRAGGSTYEDRKMRREDEITALREALSMLSGQTI